MSAARVLACICALAAAGLALAVYLRTTSEVSFVRAESPRFSAKADGGSRLRVRLRKGSDAHRVVLSGARVEPRPRSGGASRPSTAAPSSSAPSKSAASNKARRAAGRRRRARSRRFSDADVERLVGYLFLLFWYILVPLLGIAVVQRLHTHRALAPGGGGGGGARFGDDFEGAEAVVYNPLAPHSLLHTRFWSERGELIQQLNEASRACAAKEAGSAAAPRDAEACIVCLAEMADERKVRRLPCGHVFHRECCDAWVISRRKNWCPLCMTPVLSTRDMNMNKLVNAD